MGWGRGLLRDAKKSPCQFWQNEMHVGDGKKTSWGGGGKLVRDAKKWPQKLSMLEWTFALAHSQRKLKWEQENDFQKEKNVSLLDI